nr:LysR substrate-binding domain-containing protein [Pseudochelatococcus contaminans]
MPSGKRYRWEFTRHGEEMAIDVPGALTLDDSELMAEAAAGRLGIACLAEIFVRPMLEDGSLDCRTGAVQRNTAGAVPEVVCQGRGKQGQHP